LWLLKLYELDVPSREIARQLNISYITALKAKDVLRRALLAQALDARRYYALGVWPGPGRPKPEETQSRSPVFGVMDLNGYIICDLLPELSPEDMVHFKINFYMKSNHIGQMVYTSPYQQYLSLISCGPDLRPTSFIHHEDTNIPVENTGFWRFLKKRLYRVRGVTSANFPLYFKEWEMRYNHREESLVPTLAMALCTFVPPIPDKKN
jgi:transposase